VWLRREDKLRQAISWWRAAATGQYGLAPAKCRPSRHSSTGMPGVRSQVNPGWAGSRDELNGTATIAARAAGGGMT